MAWGRPLGLERLGSQVGLTRCRTFACCPARLGPGLCGGWAGRLPRAALLGGCAHSASPDSVNPRASRSMESMRWAGGPLAAGP